MARSPSLHSKAVTVDTLVTAGYPAEGTETGESFARKLSAGFTMVRVDLYSLPDGSIKFGELTLTTESGISRWHPESANLYMGSLIHLPGVDDAPADTQ